MYSLISAIAKLNQVGSRWKSVSIGTMPMKTIFSTYKKIYVTLNSPELGRNVYVDLDSIRESTHHLSTTFNAFLADNGNKNLVEVAKIPSLKTKLVKYYDAFHAGYKVTPVHPTASVESDLPDADKPYAYLTKDQSPIEELYKSSLISVNGFLHLTDYDKNGLYVIDANKSRRLSGENQIGIYSFYGIGNLKFYPIKSDMIFQTSEAVPLVNRTMIKLPEDCSNKTVMLSIGGYLSVMDEKTYRMINGDTISLNFLNFPLIERIYESRKFIDLSSLPIEKYDRNDSQMSIKDVFSDATIRAYLTLSQSFIVVLDNSELFIDKQHLDLGPNPGMLVTSTTPVYPLIVGSGKLIEYWYIYEDGLYAVNCRDNRRHYYHFRTTDKEHLVSVCDSRDPNDQRARVSNSYFLLLGVDIE